VSPSTPAADADYVSEAVFRLSGGDLLIKHDNNDLLEASGCYGPDTGEPALAPRPLSAGR